MGTSVSARKKRLNVAHHHQRAGKHHPVRREISTAPSLVWIKRAITKAYAYHSLDALVDMREHAIQMSVLTTLSQEDKNWLKIRDHLYNELRVSVVYFTLKWLREVNVDFRCRVNRQRFLR